MADLPSLNGLRAFEATARRGSIKAAAAELFVTPGAVSQQVKALEEALGVVLFHRRGGGLQLTAAGATLFPVLREAFEAIAGALQRLQGRERAGPLTVSVAPSFASKWLVPRLGRFRDQHPQIDVRISATLQLADFARDDVDVAIRLGSGRYPGLRSDLLFSDPVFPVCSPALARGTPPLRRPEDLVRHTLLHDDSYDDWQAWLQLQGVKGVAVRRGPVFSDSAITLQAAIGGQGVALARGELVAQDLHDGRLVRLFGLSMPYRFAYYLVSPPGAAEWPKVAAFREWMIEEVARYRVHHPAEGGPEAAPQAHAPAAAPDAPPDAAPHAAPHAAPRSRKAPARTARTGPARRRRPSRSAGPRRA